MSMENSAQAPGTRPLVAEAMGLFGDVVVEITAAMDRIRNDDLRDLKETARSFRDLRTALQIAFEERAKLAKFDTSGTGDGATTLDLDAARAEICRRLACLRDAGGGG